MYQTCTEFGFFQTSTARPKLFGETFPVKFFIKQCSDIFGPRFDLTNQFHIVEKIIFLFLNCRFLHTVEAGVLNTNTIYDELDLPNVVSNVVFVHGSIDPWHALGVTNSTLPNAPSIYIEGL